MVIKSICNKKPRKGEKKQLCQGIKCKLAWCSLYKQMAALCTLKIKNDDDNTTINKSNI